MIQLGFLRDFTPRRRRVQRRKQRRYQLESLEVRRLLVGDVTAVVGDSNADGIFDSGDIVQAFQQGKYETGEQATLEQGDWNGDGAFNSSDIVYAFQNGSYGLTPLAADDSGDGEVDEKTQEGREGQPNGGEPGEGPVDGGPVDGGPVDGGPVEGDVDHGEHHVPGAFERVFGRMIDRVVNKLNEGIESGDLPGNMTVEEAQALIEGLNQAKETGDKGALRDLLKTWHQEQRQDRHHDRIQGIVDSLQQRIDAGNLPGDLTQEEAQALVDRLTAAKEARDMSAVRDVLKEWHQQQRQDQHNDRYQGIVDRYQERIDAGQLPGDLTQDEAQALLDQLQAAFESRDRQAIRDAFRAFHAAKRGDGDAGGDNAGQPGDNVGQPGDNGEQNVGDVGEEQVGERQGHDRADSLRDRIAAHLANNGRWANMAAAFANRMRGR